MTPFYFGGSERRLFGIYEPARKSVGKSLAAVLCHPSGEEHVHAYRTLRQLASRMSMVGIDVLRFDYYGTGDSAGEAGDGNILGWCEDIETAIAEVKDMTGAAKVSLIGLRLGANLAARVAAKCPDEIGDLVLWEPLRSGKDICLDCHPRNDFHHVDLSSLTASLPPRTLVVLTAPASRPAEFGSHSVIRFAGVSPWIEERTATGTIPLEALHGIVKWLT